MDKYEAVAKIPHKRTGQESTNLSINSIPILIRAPHSLPKHTITHKYNNRFH